MDLVTNGIWMLAAFRFLTPSAAALLIAAVFTGGVIIPLAGLVAERAQAERIAGGRWWAVGVALFPSLALPLFIALRGFPRGRGIADRRRCFRDRREYLMGTVAAIGVLLCLLFLVAIAVVNIVSPGGMFPPEAPGHPASPKPARETVQFEAGNSEADRARSASFQFSIKRR